MINDYIRAEDLTAKKLLSCLVDTPTERRIIDHLKDNTPIILKGSRGVGKSFLLRTAEVELSNSLQDTGVLPVYFAFRRSSLIRGPAPDRFLAWMTAKICNEVARAASLAGLTVPTNSILNAIRGTSASGTPRLELVQAIFEDSWKAIPANSQDLAVPDIDLVRDAIQELCTETRIERINLLIDEAADVFNPEQQRQFFTLMRDLRSPYIAVKAAVYPGVTTFGESFRLSHDATLLSLDRNITDAEYLAQMRAMVLKLDQTLTRAVEQNPESFDTLAYAASGNPRALITTVRSNRKLLRSQVKETIQSHYRVAIWNEHSDLAERYRGHREMIDWGRQFLEGEVLPRLHARNHKFVEQSIGLLIARDAPAAAKHAMQLLCYSGIVQEDAAGSSRPRRVVGTRYVVNLGCQLALDDDPIPFCERIISSLATRTTIEYAADDASFKPMTTFDVTKASTADGSALQRRLMEPSTRLDVTSFLHRKFAELGLITIKDVLDADESVLMRAKQVKEKRSRTMRNAAVAAVVEYLSG